MITKEQVLENIKAKLGNTQKITDRTILDTVEPLLVFANDETDLVEFSDKVFLGIQSANVNFIKDTTDFVKEYAKNNPVKKEDETKQVVQATGAETQSQSEILTPEMKEAIEFFRSEKANRAKVEKQTSIINKLIDPTIGMSKEDAQDYVSLISISENTDIESESSKIVALYNKRIASTGGSATPASAGGAKQAADASADAEEIKKYL